MENPLVGQLMRINKNYPNCSYFEINDIVQVIRLGTGGQAPHDYIYANCKFIMRPSDPHFEPPESTNYVKAEDLDKTCKLKMSKEGK